MTEHPDDLCPRPHALPASSTRGLTPPLDPAAVYVCDSPEQADALLGGAGGGYVYQRYAHLNADVLAERCRELHGAERAAVTGSGMAALSLALLSLLKTGDHVVVSRYLYGPTLRLLTQEAARLGIAATQADTCDVQAVVAAFTDDTKLIVVETIANPRLQVADIAELAELAHRRGARLLVDNTFASPLVCRPLEHGADLVVESLTKIMNGHSDVMLGLLCGREEIWDRASAVLATWGLNASPWDCWLATRGLGTLHLRIERAGAGALAAARFLEEQPQVEAVDYPGLESHAQHRLARRQFGDRFGLVVTFHLRGGRPAAEAFLAACPFPFSPSLGELSTTLSHPETTSHRALSPSDRELLGVHGGTIRLSVGCESAEHITAALQTGLAAAK